MINGWSLPRERAATGSDRRARQDGEAQPAATVTSIDSAPDGPARRHPADAGDEPRRTGERGPRILEAESPDYLS
ncbi:hypothetical protein GCM10009527_070390 [Actinomadura nitritigenes]